jgi:hypothetical protein
MALRDAPATALSESHRPQSSCADAQGISRALSRSLVLNGLDSGVSSRPTYLKSNHRTIVSHIDDLFHDGGAMGIQPASKA